MTHVKFHSTFGWQPKVVQRIRLYATPNVGAPPSGGGAAAAPPTATPTAPAPTGTPAPAPTAGAGPSGVPPTSPTGTPGGLPSNAPNLDILRTNHELMTRLGGPEAVQAAVQSAQLINGLRTEGATLASELGYTPESFEAAFKDNAIDVITWLRQEKASLATSNGNGNRTPDPMQAVDARLRPLEQQIRLQQVERANSVIEAELGRVFSEHAIFKGANDVPPETQGFIANLTKEILKYDQPGLKKVMAGDMAPVKAAFDSAIDQFFKAVTAYSGWQTKRGTSNGNGQPPAGSGQPAAASGTPPAFNLADLINGKEEAFQGLGTTRR